MNVHFPYPGGACLFPSGTQDRPLLRHLAVALTGAHSLNNQDAKVLVFTISSIRKLPSDDLTCALMPGDHDFISNPSYVVYAFPYYLSPEDIERYLKSGYYQLRSPVPAEILIRISIGVLESSRTPKRAIKFFKDWAQNQ